MKSICVFCGSSLGCNDAYINAARDLGALLAQRSIRLVYGGANVGLMGVLANACLEHGGTVVGVMPENLVQMEVVHEALTELRVVGTMHERKALMSGMADGFISLPGGIGTLEETFEMFTWLQLGLQNKPIGLLNTRGFFDRLIMFLKQMVEEGFLLSAHRDMMFVEQNDVKLLHRMENNTPKTLKKWFDVDANRA